MPRVQIQRGGKLHHVIPTLIASCSNNVLRFTSLIGPGEKFSQKWSRDSLKW